jgi:hypothetical protein
LGLAGLLQPTFELAATPLAKSVSAGLRAKPRQQKKVDAAYFVTCVKTLPEPAPKKCVSSPAKGQPCSSVFLGQLNPPKRSAAGNPAPNEGQ